MIGNLSGMTVDEVKNKMDITKTNGHDTDKMDDETDDMEKLGRNEGSFS